MIVTLLSQNVEFGAVRAGRWPRLVDAITAQEPDLVALQEVDWLADASHPPGVLARGVARLRPARLSRLATRLGARLGSRALAGVLARDRTGRDLGMRVIVGRSRNLPTAVAYREDGPAGLRLAGVEVKYWADLHHGYTATRFTLPGLPVLLVLISVHLTPYSAAAASQEAQLLAARAYRHGGLGILAGDINHMALGDPEPDWEAVQPYNRSSRCLPRAHPDDPWRGNRIVGQVLRDARFTDVAAAIAARRGDASLLASTGRHGLLRVDQVHVTAPLASAIVDYQRLTTSEDTASGQAGSDHDGLLVRVDTDLIDTTKLRDYT